MIRMGSAALWVAYSLRFPRRRDRLSLSGFRALLEEYEAKAVRPRS